MSPRIGNVYLPASCLEIKQGGKKGFSLPVESDKTDLEIIKDGQGGYVIGADAKRQASDKLIKRLKLPDPYDIYMYGGKEGYSIPVEPGTKSVDFIKTITGTYKIDDSAVAGFAPRAEAEAKALEKVRCGFHPFEGIGALLKNIRKIKP